MKVAAVTCLKPVKTDPALAIVLFYFKVFIKKGERRATAMSMLLLFFNINMLETHA